MADEAQNTEEATQGFEVSSSDYPEQQEQKIVETTEEQVSEEVETVESSESKDNDSEKSEEKSNDGKSEEGEAQESGEDTTANASKKKKGVEKRISKLVKEREAEKREKERLKREIEELKGQNKASNESIKEPKEEDFKTYSDYLDALDEHEKKSAEIQQKKEEQKTEIKEPEDIKLTEDQENAKAIITEYLADAELPDDFNEVALSDDVAITPEMIEAIAECDDPAKVLYHLGKNKDLASEIARKSKVQQVKSIDNIDRTVGIEPKKPVKLTNKPDAIEPVKGTDVQPKTYSEMTFEEYERERSRSKPVDGW